MEGAVAVAFVEPKLGVRSNHHVQVGVTGKLTHSNVLCSVAKGCRQSRGNGPAGVAKENVNVWAGGDHVIDSVTVQITHCKGAHGAAAEHPFRRGVAVVGPGRIAPNDIQLRQDHGMVEEGYVLFSVTVKVTLPCAENVVASGADGGCRIAKIEGGRDISVGEASGQGVLEYHVRGVRRPIVCDRDGVNGILPSDERVGR